MRIGINADNFFMRNALGIGKYIQNLITNLLTIDKNNSYLLFDLRRHASSPFCADNVLSLTLPLSRKILYPAWHILRFPSIENFAGKLDIIHAPDPMSAPPYHKGKLIVTVFDMTCRLFSQMYSLKQRIFARLAEKRVFKEADLLIAISENTKRDILRLIKYPEEKIKVIPLGVEEYFRPINDKDVLSCVLTKYGISSPFILFSGNINPRKNILMLLDALIILKNDMNFKHLLVVTGVKGWQSEVLFLRIEKLDLKKEVLFLDYVPEEDMPILMNAADIVVYPSLYEGFGLPVLEAMACGTPVIVSNTSSLPEVVGDAGILVDPKNAGQWAIKISDVIQNESLRENMRGKGLVGAQQFSWRKVAMETLSLYESVYKNG